MPPKKIAPKAGKDDIKDKKSKGPRPGVKSLVPVADSVESPSPSSTPPPPPDERADNEGQIPIDPELIIRSGLSEQQVQELREIFNLVDEDGGGTIDNDELGGLLRSLGIKATKTELENIIDEIDINKTGEIEFEAFVLAMAKKPSTSYGIDSLVRAFQRFETEPNFLTMESLMSVMCDVGDLEKRVSREDAEELLLGVAPQIKETPLEYRQFLKMLFQ